jgi:hypothetical protein
MLEAQTRRQLAREINTDPRLGPGRKEWDSIQGKEPDRNLENLDYNQRGRQVVGRFGDRPERPAWLKANPILNRLMEEIEQGKVGPSYRLLTPGRVDLSKVPGRGTDAEKRTALQMGRWRSRVEMQPILEDLPKSVSRGQFRVPPGFGFMSGQKVQQVSTPERIREELIARMGVDPDQLDSNPRYQAMIEDLQSYQRQIRPFMAPHQADPKQGALFNQGVPSVDPRERQTRGMHRVGGRTQRAERLRAYWSRRELRGRRRDEGGYISQVTGRFIDRGAAQYIENIMKGQREGQDIGFDDPDIKLLGEMLFRHSLGTSEQRAAPRRDSEGNLGPDYRDTKKYPVTSTQDIRDFMFGRSARPGMGMDWVGRQGQPGSYRMRPTKRGQQEYRPGMVSASSSVTVPARILACQAWRTGSCALSQGRSPQRTVGAGRSSEFPTPVHSLALESPSGSNRQKPTTPCPPLA